MCAAPVAPLSTLTPPPSHTFLALPHQPTTPTNTSCHTSHHSTHSNDVRRFDDGLSFWLFVWAGPLEAVLVLLMVSLELGFVPAVCGMAAMLAVIPIQV